MKNRTNHNPAAAGGTSRRTELALGILEQVCSEVARNNPADASLQAVFRKHREYGSRDRRFYSRVVFSYFRWRGWMEGAAPVKACAVALLLDAEDVNDDLRTVCTDAGFSEGKMKPMAAMTLPEKAAMAGSLLGRSVAVENIIPKNVLDRIAFPRHLNPWEARSQFLESMQIRPPAWLRFATAVDAMAIEAPGAQAHPRIPTALALPENFNRGLLNTPEGRKADVQDLSSQCAGLIAAPQAGESWWDVCSGAGGKALHLAALSGCRAKILATDLRPSSVGQIRERAERTGMRGIRTAVLDGSKDSPGCGDFDGIIVDAPCSGIGTWPRNPDARWRFDPSNINRSAAVQKRIVMHVSQFLRPGGRLIYAVCTCTADETDAVAAAFLNEKRNFEPLDFTHPLTGAACPGQCMIWPADGPCNGMFIAGFRKAE